MLGNREIAEKILAKIDMSIIANKNIETKVLSMIFTSITSIVYTD